MSIDPNLNKYNILNDIDITNIHSDKDKLQKEINSYECNLQLQYNFQSRIDFLKSEITELNILEEAIESLSKRDVNSATQTPLDEKVYQLAKEYLKSHGVKFEVIEEIQVNDLKEVILDYLSITDILASGMADDKVRGLINRMGEGHIKEFISILDFSRLAVPQLLFLILNYKKHANEASIKFFYESITQIIKVRFSLCANLLNALRNSMTAAEKISYSELEKAMKQRLITLGYEAINSV